MSKQSSVEWLIDKLSNYDEEMLFLFKNEIEQAKAMHKEEIEEAWNDGCYQSSDFPKTSDAEKYYEQTFGDEKEVL